MQFLMLWNATFKSMSGQADKQKHMRHILTTLNIDQLILRILKKGNIDFDVLTVRDEEIPALAKAISQVVNEINGL